jgi:hypothetical protein
MRPLFFGLTTLTLLACGDTTGPAGVPDTQLHIVVQDPLAPPLYAQRDTFWAHVGQDRELRMYYQGATPTQTGDELLRFEVPGNGLLRKPDGSLFQPTDSILITVTVVDPSKFLFQFEPTGLVFNPDQPARLKALYVHANHDFNGDGVVDATDAAIESTLDLWKRESPTAPWFKIGAVNFEALEELDANIFSFTSYAIAW